MKTMTLLAMVLLTALPYASARANGIEPAPLSWVAGQNGCHVLLTEQECGRHREALSALVSYSERYTYLEQHGISMREREVMCSCLRNPSSAVYAPQSKQHLARH